MTEERYPWTTISRLIPYNRLKTEPVCFRIVTRFLLCKVKTLGTTTHPHSFIFISTCVCMLLIARQVKATYVCAYIHMYLHECIPYNNNIHMYV